jgi:plasmid stabilization system protein ParE
MNSKLVVRPQAEFDIIKHSLYLLEHRPHGGVAFDDSVEAVFREIAANPRGGTILDNASVPDLELRFVRPKGFKNYLIIYQVTDDCATVLRVLHGSQDLDSALRP